MTETHGSFPSDRPSWSHECDYARDPLVELGEDAFVREPGGNDNVRCKQIREQRQEDRLCLAKTPSQSPSAP
jgi:hypothetical protein